MMEQDGAQNFMNMEVIMIMCKRHVIFFRIELATVVPAWMETGFQIQILDYPTDVLFQLKI